MDKYYLFKQEMKKEDIINVFTTAVNDSKKFHNEVDSELITFTDGYLIYPFIDGMIKNVEYLIVRNGKEETGVIDASYSLASKDFILNKLNTKDFAISVDAISDYNVFNYELIKKYDDLFIEKLLDKTTDSICQRHNLLLQQPGNEIDIAPVREFYELNKRYYLEEVYLITFYERTTKKTYKSLYSPLLKKFYYLDYIKSPEYTAFYKQFKRPVVYIPLEYRDYYYDIAFEVYLKTIEELKYISANELYTKIRKNVKYKGYTKFNDYLFQLIFYFRRKAYLSEYKYESEDFKEKIFYSYLTLKYNEASGYLLANYVKENLVEDDYLKLLTISARLGNSFARKSLFEHFANPRYYKETMVKRYS